ncbi:MAG TPA: hypothetical protein VM513_32690 [Kofleriaceae bacterium]|jgi:hypothetical protein|nr:hypothetical protein [Kofleriaceae bacterium]
MKRTAMVMLAVLASCDGQESQTEDAKLGPLTFEVPADWQRTNHERTGTVSAEWRPDTNARKESVTVVRSADRAPAEGFSAERLANLLANAQGTLRGARVSKVTPLSTRRGLTGARIDVSFQPGDGPTRYRRVHAVLVDDTRSELVHVLYTAASPDDHLTAFYTVLESLHREEG